ncbi:MAG: M23 family metallopeptidase [Bacillota bacterium]
MVVKQAAKQYIKKAAIAAGKKMLAAIAGFLSPVLWPLVAVFVLAAVFFAAVYGSMPLETHLTGVEASEQDKEIHSKTDLAVQKWNVADYYIAPGESPENSSWYEIMEQEKEERNTKPWLPEEEKLLDRVQDLFDKNTGKARYMDNNGRDAELANGWGDIYSTLFYTILQTGEFDFPRDEIEKVAEDLHPYFFVKKSSVTERYPTEDGMETYTYTIYLLVEAKTIRGWYQYKYEWHTDHYENGGSRTYERLLDVVTLERWEWIENYLIELYELEPQEKTITRMMVLNAAEGFSEKKEWLDWLIQSFDGGTWASGAMVPTELRQLFQEAEAIYGIPWWFLAAVAYVESSFDPRAENQSSGCYGLMQVSPANWRAYAPQLGFDVNRDRDDPRAQVMVGAFLLYEQGLKQVNWEASDWKEQTLGTLAFYGGFRSIKEGVPVLDEIAMERARSQYASKIWALAEKFRDVKAVWPVPGRGRGDITSPFGWRIHPILKTLRHHNGIDIDALLNEPVVSVSSGVVSSVGYQPDGAGNYVYIRDGMYEYAYFHLNSYDVTQGQTTQVGQEIGKAGATGLSTGVHLHFGVRPIGGEWIDPLNVLP